MLIILFISLKFFLNSDNFGIFPVPIAIGTGKIPKLSELRKNFREINNIISKLKKNQKHKIIYGGSVNSKNVSELKKINDLKGFLIGSASLKAKNFIDIIKKSTN